jgi:hypothetical protein
MEDITPYIGWDSDLMGQKLYSILPLLLMASPNLFGQFKLETQQSPIITSQWVLIE